MGMFVVIGVALGVIGESAGSEPSARTPTFEVGTSRCCNRAASAAKVNGFFTSLATFNMTSYLEATSTLGS